MNRFKKWIFILTLAHLVLGSQPARSEEKPAEIGASACASCHADKAEAFKTSLHGRKLAAVKKISFEKSCESCHGPGSLHMAAAGEKTDPSFASINNPAKLSAKDQAETCFACHKDSKDLMFWKTSAHANNNVGCLKCHSVHEGQGPRSLLKGESETCLKCHAKQKADMRLPSHHPVPEGKMACTSCHNPHGGIEKNLKADSLEELCAKCHSEKLGPFVYEHAPVADGCNNCHLVHGSANDMLLKQVQPYLCSSCHIKEHAASSLARVTGKVRCTDCHREIHGSDRSSSFKQ